MKQQKLFHLVLSAMLIVCTTGCYDKDEIKDAEKYLFKDIQYSFEEGDGFSTYDVELLPFIMENNLNNSITTTNSPLRRHMAGNHLSEQRPRSICMDGGRRCVRQYPLHVWR